MLNVGAIRPVAAVVSILYNTEHSQILMADHTGTKLKSQNRRGCEI